jgi:uncharacterized membrane protein YfcA
MSAGDLLLAGTALLAAAVNGGLGYGFSSITVPVALLFHASRALNPALVLLELFINALALFANRRGLAAVLPRMWPLLLGAVPGVVLGSLVLVSASPGPLKLFTFAALLPLILLQSAGIRRPIRRERAAAIPAGAALGLLYGATTISGPPLALLFNNQGLARDEFRAALSLFRIVESSCTAVAYLALGLFSAESLRLSGQLAPAVLVGLPLGYALLRKLPVETFRRTCMAVDALLVGFGLARSAIAQGVASPVLAWAGFAAVVCFEAVLVASWLRGRDRAEAAT